jgi:integrase
MRTFNEITTAFLAEKRISISAKTLMSYKGKLKVFQDFVCSLGLVEPTLSQLPKETINRFFIFLASIKNLDRPTCEKYYQHLRTLYRYAVESGDIDHVPFERVPLPMKKEDMGAQLISENHLKCILTEIKQRDNQLFLGSMMEYYCFIRPGREMRGMKVGDIDLENGLIRIPAITAKSKRDDTVTMPDHLIQLCREYGLGEADKSLYVFSKNGSFGEHPYKSDSMRYRFNLLREELGLPKGYKWYSFKHTGSTALHQSGASLRDLMDQLRHKSLNTSMYYIKKHSGFVNDRIKNNFPCPI